MAMIENAAERNMNDPDCYYQLATRQLVVNERLVPEYVNTKNSCLGCVTARPRAVNFFPSYVPCSFGYHFSVGS